MKIEVGSLDKHEKQRLWECYLAGVHEGLAFLRMVIEVEDRPFLSKSQVLETIERQMTSAKSLVETSKKGI